MDTTEVRQLLMRLQNKSIDLPNKYMSENDAILEALDSHIMQSLETPAISFTSLNFSKALRQRKTKKSLSVINQTTL